MPRILVDCTRSHLQPEMATGIQRVTRQIAARCRDQAPEGWEAIPVYYSHGAWKMAKGGSLMGLLSRLRASRKRVRETFRRAFRGRGASERVLMAPLWIPVRLAELGVTLLVHATKAVIYVADLPHLVIPRRGDVLLHPEYPLFHVHGIVSARRKGVAVVTVIHDVLPITHERLFEPDPKVAAWFAWVASHADAILCVSDATGRAVREVLAPRTATIETFHLGGDFSGGKPSAAPASTRSTRPRFLMVGTLEPRKRHADVLSAFEQLWDAGHEAELHIVGKLGWMTSGLAARIQGHAELGRRLFWDAAASDADLESAYARAHAVIAASEAEGFGLPIVEALQRGTPVIASDIPVFREVAGDHADYFPPGDVAALAALVRRLAALGRRTVSGFRWPSWDDATRRVLQLAARQGSQEAVRT